jgi:hypothetical protein
MPNDINLLNAVIDLLKANGIDVWVFGGWAEELWRLRPPGPHGDIDFLYPAENLDALDAFLTQFSMPEIEAKRFSHKRAVEFEGVLVEFILVEREGDALVTRFFDGLVTHSWPVDTLSETLMLKGTLVHVAGVDALTGYRQIHGKVDHAYQEYAGRDSLNNCDQLPDDHDDKRHG